MATATAATERAQRIEVGLREIAAEADYLPRLAEIWADDALVDRDDWYLEWGELMARLEGLEQEYHAGVMTAEQQARYRALVRQLQQQLPLLKQLRLPLPRVGQEDRRHGRGKTGRRT